MRKAFITIVIPSILGILTACSQQEIKVTGLRCENLTNPLNIEKHSPRLSWNIESPVRGQVQTAYHILVAGSEKKLKKNEGDVWDSDRVESDQSILVDYNGSELKSGVKYFWKVKIWGREGEESDWSEPASWRMGLMDPAGWAGAKWIGYRILPDSMRLVPGSSNYYETIGNRAKERSIIPCFRKEFTVGKKISNACLYISGLGHYDAEINGNKVSKAFLVPGWTHYDKSVLYNCYDVTDLLKKGENAIGVMVGNGFYYINRERYTKLVVAFGEPSLISELRINYSDGTEGTIISDQSWRCKPSPVTYTSIYGGEDYDARMEEAGWTKPGFDDSSWQAALPVPAPHGRLIAENDCPVSVMETIEVKEIKTLPENRFLYDFGQNASGIVELKIKGKAGQQVRLIPAELITKDSIANQKASGEPFYFTYTLKGNGVEIWRPRFTYYGFRYVQVEGAVPDKDKSISELPRITDLKMLHTRNSSPANGNFECSNELFNRTNELIRWAIKSNFQSVITDCPHREKLGWLEQTYLMGNGIQFNFDLHPLYSKQVNDMMEAQTEEGLIPGFAPEWRPSRGAFRDSPEWGSASVIIPWLIYQWYGDKSVMEKAWPMMVRYVDYLKSKSDQYIVSHGLGDWFDLGPKTPGPAQLTPVPLTATAIYYYDLALLSRMAGLLGKDSAKNYYSSWAEDVKKAFNDKFFNYETGIYATGSQTAMAMPWCVGLVDDDNLTRVINNLSDSIIAAGRPLTAGDVGFHFLVRALTEGGKSQLLYEMNARDDIPGYGFQLKKGATALTESWAALEIVSNNHLMLGHLMEWFYKGLGGISQEENSTGFKEIIIKPEMVGDLTFVKTCFRSPYGEIVSNWQKQAEETIMEVEIPVNTTARIFIPVKDGSKITESGRNIEDVEDIKYTGDEGDRKIYMTGSGKYRFKVEN